MHPAEISFNTLFPSIKARYPPFTLNPIGESPKCTSKDPRPSNILQQKFQAMAENAPPNAQKPANTDAVDDAPAAKRAKTTEGPANVILITDKSRAVKPKRKVFIY